MQEQNCIFCKIISQGIFAKVIAETEDVLVIQDRAPKAPVHYLIIPKKHIKDINSLEQEDASLIANMMFMVKQLSEKLSDSGSFRLIVNYGLDAGQSVFHLHFHFVSGKKMADF